MRKGFVAISSVLIISVVTLGIILTVSLSAIGESQVGLAVTDGEKELTLVESCVEDGLLNIWTNPSYTGGTVSKSEGTCSLTVINSAGTYTLTATSTNVRYKRTIQTTLTRTSQINLLSWTEI